MTENFSGDPRSLMLEKVNSYLYARKLDGKTPFSADTAAYTFCKAVFWVCGVFCIFLTMLHSLVVYMALTSELKEQYRVINRGYILPLVLMFVLCIVTLVLEKCKKHTAAFILNWIMGFVQIMMIVQLFASSTEEYTPDLQAALIVMYFVLFIMQICSVCMFILRRRDKKLKDYLCDEALRKIYAANNSGEMMTGDELADAIKNFSPDFDKYLSVRKGL